MIRIMGSGAAAVYLNGCVGLRSKPDTLRQPDLSWMSKYGPVDRTLGDHSLNFFSGDNPTMAHQMLWKKTEYLASIGGLPPVQESCDVVIVGGGMSGLLTAHFLKDLNPVILEQAPRFGGNSRAESWHGIDYSIGTAYMGVPTKGSPIDELFARIGFKDFQVATGEDPVFIDGKRHEHIWDNGTLPENQAQFRKLKKHFKDVFAEENGLQYPEIPYTDKKGRSLVVELDQMSFMTYLEKVAGEPLHPHLKKIIEHYFWSACAASATEISAAVGLNFFASDFSAMAVAPGGNAAIGEAVLRDLTKSLPTDRLRPGSFVFDVRQDKDGAVVTYLKDDKVHSLRAKAVVMSCPKFIVGHLIDDLEPQRKEIIKNLRYRSYLIANVLIDQPVGDNFFDLFFFNSSPEKLTDIRSDAHKQKITDFVLANYTKPKDPRTVLTLSRGFPYDKSREEIYAKDAYAKYKGEFEQQIYSEILPMLKIKKEKLVDIRITRWGHPLPLSAVGNIASGKINELRKPFGKRIFFVEQDNWMVPAFETCFAEANHWAPKIREII